MGNWVQCSKTKAGAVVLSQCNVWIAVYRMA